MTEMLAEVRRWLSTILELLLFLVAVLALLQVLFADSFTRFFGIDVVGNIGEVVGKFGDAGLVGVIAAALVVYLIMRTRADGGSTSQPGSPTAGGPQQNSWS